MYFITFTVVRSLGKFLFQGKIPCVFNLSSEPVRQNQRQLVLCGVLNRPVQVNDSVDSKFLDIGIYRKNLRLDRVVSSQTTCDALNASTLPMLLTLCFLFDWLLSSLWNDRFPCETSSYLEGKGLWEGMRHGKQPRRS